MSQINEEETTEALPELSPEDYARLQEMLAAQSAMQGDDDDDLYSDSLASSSDAAPMDGIAVDSILLSVISALERVEDQRHLAADIELVRETYQEREKELLVAAEIGKMLVEKNRTLEDDLAERENEFKKAIEEAYNYNRELESQVTNLKSIVVGNESKQIEFSNILQDLQNKLAKSHSERVTLESHLSRQEEEISVLEAKLKKASATSQHNQKASHESHLLFEELERCRGLLEEAAKREEELKKENQKLIRKANKVEKDSSEDDNSKKIEALEEQLKHLKAVEKERDELKQRLRKLSDYSSETNDEKATLQRSLASMVNANKVLQDQLEEQQRVLQDNRDQMEQLRLQLEEQRLLAESAMLKEESLAKELELQRRVSSQNLKALMKSTSVLSNSTAEAPAATAARPKIPPPLKRTATHQAGMELNKSTSIANLKEAKQWLHSMRSFKDLQSASLGVLPGSNSSPANNVAIPPLRSPKKSGAAVWSMSMREIRTKPTNSIKLDSLFNQVPISSSKSVTNTTPEPSSPLAATTTTITPPSTSTSSHQESLHHSPSSAMSLPAITINTPSPRKQSSSPLRISTSAEEPEAPTTVAPVADNTAPSTTTTTATATATTIPTPSEPNAVPSTPPTTTTTTTAIEPFSRPSTIPKRPAHNHLPQLSSVQITEVESKLKEILPWHEPVSPDSKMSAEEAEQKVDAILWAKDKEWLVNQLLTLRTELRSGLEEYVLFLGKVARLRDLLNNAHVAVMSSRMCNIVPVAELLKVSNVCIDSVFIEVNTVNIPFEGDFDRPANPFMRAISGAVCSNILELIGKESTLRKAYNDLMELIVSPTPRSIKSFEDQFAVKLNFSPLSSVTVPPSPKNSPRQSSVGSSSSLSVVSSSQSSDGKSPRNRPRASTVSGGAPVPIPTKSTSSNEGLGSKLKRWFTNN